MSSSVRPRALLSVSDKTGIEHFARELAARGYEILSTGGTAAALRQADVAVTDVSAITHFPEIMGGRVKTLHPAVHGGLLGRAGLDEAVAADNNIRFIDILAVNLYPFRQVIAQPDCSIDDAIENIDIGGPAMLRAAAKNHQRVTVIVDHADYPAVLAALDDTGDHLQLRQRLAVKAYAHTAQYDGAISQYLGAHLLGQQWPDIFVTAAEHHLSLRYGENPHQEAALYRTDAAANGSVARAEQLQGKALSYNNIADADAAVQCVKAFREPACVIVKHANPCGVAVAEDLISAYQRAYVCDTTSAFGGIIAFNRPLDGATAQAIIDQQYAEVIIAPALSAEAAAALSRKPNIRVLALGECRPAGTAIEIRTIEDGLLLQTRDLGNWQALDPVVVSERSPGAREWADLQFAWTVAKFVKSNAIVYALDNCTCGIGAGQMSRVDSARIAAQKALEANLDLTGAVMASDAFFPFRDGIDTAAERGITAIVHPGGALRDEEIIAAANDHGIAMVFTGMRHFRH